MDRGKVRFLAVAGLACAVLLGVAGAQDPPPRKPVDPPAPSVEETSELLLFLRPGTDAAAYAKENDLALRRTLRSDPDAHVFAAADVPSARAHRGKARADLRVRRAYLNPRLHRVRFWQPNDKYYPNGGPPDFPGPGQWHLGNGAAPAADPRIPAAWLRDVTGAGVLIGIVDDGLETAHPDLGPNYVAAHSYDFGQGDETPNPVKPSDAHGTSVAGVAAARGGNTIGTTGAAPLAGLAGLRVDFSSTSADSFIDATLYRSSATSLPLAIAIKNHSYGYPSPYVESEAERDAVEFSADSGTIHVFAAGNGRGTPGEDSNKQDVQSSPAVIAVAAVGSNGKVSPYSSFGANIFVATPSSGVPGFDVTTTDRSANFGYNGNGDADLLPQNAWTSTFSGTSSAAPLAAGVLALAKQVQPALNTRFAKHLLVRSSFKVDPDDKTPEGGGDDMTNGSAWKTNAAGRSFNQNYGFGLIDADALTQQALLYSGVTTPVEILTVGPVTVANGQIPDNSPTGVEKTFTLNSSTPLEEILITLNVTHLYRGEIEATLTSPSGTTCRLVKSKPVAGVNLNWTFVSNAFWGENPSANFPVPWKLKVSDAVQFDVGTWTSFTVEARMGNLILNTTPPVVSSITRADVNPTSAASAAYTVTFSKAVTGLDAADFALTTTGGIAGASVSPPSGSGSVYTVTVNTGSGDGTIQLDLVDNDSIQDGSGLPLGGAGAGNGNFTGPAYTVDKSPPTVTISHAGQADPVKTGPIVFMAQFNEDVSGFDGSDVSFVGSTAGGALVASVSPPGTGQTFTISVSGMTSTGLVVVSIPAGRAVNAAGVGNTASTSLDASVFYDVTPPTVTISRGGTQADPTNVASIVFDVLFSETVIGFATGDVSFTDSTAGGTLLGTVSGLGPSYTVTVTGMNASGSVVVSILAGVAADTANNANSASTSATVAYDVTPPSVTINQAGGQGDPANAGPIRFSVLFSEGVFGFEPADISFVGSTAGGTLVADVSSPPYIVSVTGMTTPGLVVISIPAGAVADAIGFANVASTNVDNTVMFNPSGLAVEINRADGQADPTNSGAILFTVVFSETVNNFATGDVSFANSTAGGPLVGTVSGSGTTYTVSVDGMTTSGNVVASILAGVATNAALTPNAASTSLDNIVAWDVTAPTVTISRGGTQADPTNVASIVFDVLFSETVIGFDGNDVFFTGSTAGGTLAATVGGTGPAYTVTVTGMNASGSVVVSIPAGRAADTANNANSASTSATVFYDTTPPSVTINQAGGQGDPVKVGPILFNVVFSEAVTGFEPADVSLASSTAGGTLVAQVGGAGTDWTVSVSGMTSNGTIVVSIPAGAAMDGVGNLSLASTSDDATVTFDIEPPVVTIEQAAGQADPTNDDPIQFTVVFDEPAVGFATGDVTLSGTAGGAAVVTGGPLVFTVTVTGMTATGKVTVAIPAGAATDAAGNAMEAATSLDDSVTYDIGAPTATIAAAAGQADPTNAGTIQFTVVFSEPVSGFENEDVVLGGATGALVTGGPTTYNVSVSGMSATGAVTASIAASAAVDDAGNPSVASGMASVAYDITPPSVTINQAVGQADPTSGAAPVFFTAVFSQAVNGFTAGDVALGGTAGGTVSVSGGSTTWTVSVAGFSTAGTVTVSIPAGAATDLAGNASLASTSTDASVAVDSAPPVVLSLGSPSADGLYGPGAAVQVTVLFSKPVTVTNIPRLTLETGASDAAATYDSGSGSATLTFSFTVAAGHESADLDVASTAALSLQGGTIQDAVGNDAVLTLPAPGGPGSLGAAKAIVVDGTPPLAGTVSDGWTGADLDIQLSRTTIAAHWTGFDDPQSGIAAYEWAIGTTSGGQQVLAFAGVGTRTQASTSAIDVLLSLSTGAPYYVTVRATNGTGLTVTATSDGVTVTGTAPSGPPAPAAFYATPADQSALLDWIASGGAAFHRVWWKPAASPWTDATLMDGLAGTDAVVLGLINGVSHDFRLKAVDADGNESPGILASATPRPAVSIGGLGTYPTPQDALAAAVAGETVLLGHGTFFGPLTLPPGVSIEGISPVHTFIVGTPGSPVITAQGSFPADGTSTISGLTITTGSTGVDAGAADVALDHVVIHHVASHGATSALTGRLRAVNCALMSNGGDGLRALGTASARNCVAGRNGGLGLNLPAGAPTSYTLAFANVGGDFAAGLSGPGNSTAAAAFADEGANDYRETGLSPTVDAGDPADGFSREPAPNGSRINQGAFGDTRWAASRSTPAPSGGGGGGGGRCGATGLELLLSWLVLAGLRRLRR